jgi:hypothetical protein
LDDAVSSATRLPCLVLSPVSANITVARSQLGASEECSGYSYEACQDIAAGKMKPDQALTGNVKSLRLSNCPRNTKAF